MIILAGSCAAGRRGPGHGGRIQRPGGPRPSWPRGCLSRESAYGPALEVIFDFQGEFDAQAQATGGGPEDTGTGNATGPMSAATVWAATLRSPWGDGRGRSPPPGGLGGNQPRNWERTRDHLKTSRLDGGDLCERARKAPSSFVFGRLVEPPQGILGAQTSRGGAGCPDQSGPGWARPMTADTATRMTRPTRSAAALPQAMAAAAGGLR